MRTSVRLKPQALSSTAVKTAWLSRGLKANSVTLCHHLKLRDVKKKTPAGVFLNEIINKYFPVNVEILIRIIKYIHEKIFVGEHQM